MIKVEIEVLREWVEVYRGKVEKVCCLEWFDRSHCGGGQMTLGCS